MPKKVKTDTLALLPHVEPYAFSSDEETPAAKTTTLSAKTPKARPGRKGLADDPSEHDAYAVLDRHNAQYKHKLEDLPWHTAYLPEKRTGDPHKHVTFHAVDQGPDHHYGDHEGYLQRRNDTKRELQRLIHNHWVFKATYYILAQRELETIHAGEHVSLIKHLLHKLQGHIEEEREWQMTVQKDTVPTGDGLTPHVITTNKELRRARNGKTPAMDAEAWAAMHHEVETALKTVGASKDDQSEWIKAYTYGRRKKQITVLASDRPPNSKLALRRLFFAKRLLMRAAEHVLATTMTTDPTRLHPFTQYYKHGDSVASKLAEYREELRRRFKRKGKKARKNKKGKHHDAHVRAYKQMRSHTPAVHHAPAVHHGPVVHHAPAAAQKQRANAHGRPARNMMGG
jgi:hypothetical protein